MYFFIIIEIFIINQKFLIGISFDKLLEFLLIIIGLYVILFFLKGNNNDFLIDENKEDIRELYNKYYYKLDKLNVNGYVFFVEDIKLNKLFEIECVNMVLFVVIKFLSEIRRIINSYVE